MSAPPRLIGALLEAHGPIRHGFYGRRGGVSTGGFESLNCGWSSGDLPDSVAANRRRVADDLGGGGIFTNKQIHGNRVRVIEAGADPDEVFEGDGLVTREVGAALGVLVADCAPVLFADPAAAVIGAAHAGWKGALRGVTDAVIEKMTDLGARPERMVCVIGPAIQAGSYRVGAELVARFETDSPVRCETCFRKDNGADESGTDQTGHGSYYFDLPRYLRMRIARAGIAPVETLADDTFKDERRFFSYRRSRHRGDANYGRQIGAIVLV